MAKKKEIMERLIGAVDEQQQALQAYENAVEEANGAEATDATTTAMVKSRNAVLSNAAEVSDAYDELLAWEEKRGEPNKKFDDATYYVVELGEMKMDRARCKKCIKEMDPRAVGRHLGSDGCKKAEEAIKARAAKANGDGDGQAAG